MIKKESFTQFYDVENKDEFIEVIRLVESNIQEGDIITLQIETHGADEGICLSSGEIVKWSELYDLIRPINIKIGHLLLLVLSMCKSIALISNINLEKRAPYRAVICTTRTMYPDELYDGFMAFYDKFFNLLDIGNAVHDLQKAVVDKDGHSPFQILSAESVFDETLSTERNIDDLCILQLKRQRLPCDERAIEQMRLDIRKLFVELKFKYRDYYNFRDLYN